MNNSRILEIRERLKQIESERKLLLEELYIIEQIPSLPLVFGSQSSSSVPKTSEEKIQLFSKLFRCRENVYPKLWENFSKGTKDGLNAIMQMQCGPVRHTMIETDNQNELIKKVIVRESTFKMPDDSSKQPQIHEIWYQMIKDQDRLNLIALDVADCLKNNRFPLILSERRDHLEYLSEKITSLLNDSSSKGFILLGDIGKKEVHIYDYVDINLGLTIFNV